ncbi:MAG: YdbH domain-containing protein [Porphyrobacter sp.]|nr:YdbH domain-containing protein [Porphyrobacter sp.]
MATLAEIEDPMPERPRRRVGCWVLLVVCALLALGAAILWISREELADSLISRELANRGIRATYEIESIGGHREVLRNVVVGDPKRPDLTIERAEVTIGYGLWLPRIASVRLVRPRLFGSYIDGKLSFGALDPLLFEGPKRAFELPDMRLTLVDGRALVEGTYGPVGIKVDGRGHLQDGFEGEVAAIAPRLAVPGCAPIRTTLYGRIAIQSRRPAFEGPVRLGAVSCPDQQVQLARAAFQVDARADEAFKAFEGELGVDVGAMRFAVTQLAGLSGKTRFSWRDNGLTARYELAGTEFTTNFADASRLELDGSLRARRNFDRIEIDTQLDGSGVGLGSGLDGTLADAAKSASGTMLGPILDQVRRQLAAQQDGNRLVADVTVRRTGDRTSVVIPDAYLRGRGGAALLSLSRFQLATGGTEPALLSGNFLTGGEKLPRIAGRVEQRADGGMELRFSMAEYAVGQSRLAIPELALMRRGDGVLGFAGQIRASGALPGGRAENLLLPVSGNWSPMTGLSLWHDCTDLQFEALQLANLSFGHHRLTLCPARGAPIVRYGSGGLRVAAGAPSMQLAGHLGETPIALRTGAIGFAYPGAVSAKQVLVTLGPADTASTFAISDLSAQVDKDIAGKFSGADIRLSAVQLDLIGAEGNWRYAEGRMTIGDARFQLVDRIAPARFEPLSAEGAGLALVDNRITAEALLREPKSGREVARVDIVHNLNSGRGNADLAVAGLVFDSAMQPLDLTRRAEGVIALANGTVTGNGRIDWDEHGITSRGRFSSESLDFAAAFGPVKGASGTVVFTDLLGLTTAPDQTIKVASINPGIEINDGELSFAIRNGEVLDVKGGSWPFLGGTLKLQPVEIRFGVPEERRYVLEIVGLDAGRFVERMELNNMAATGVFDGTVPLVFDTLGNGRVEGGLLISRPPGGNVSYVGELTYEDLGAVANLAFDALRSLDYRQMRVQMDGSLTGEIVTRVRLDGVSQGAGAEKNLITNAIAGLPVRVDVNIRAPFYQLIGVTRALYDPAAIRDPREIGLIDAQGNPIKTQSDGSPSAPAPPQDPIADEAVIQRRESEEMP